MKISVAIPCYEMLGDGAAFLKRALDSIKGQSFDDYEIVVSDNSKNNEIENLCEGYKKLKYFRNEETGMATNTNNAIQESTGEIIKILYQDDFLAHPNSLRNIADNFDGHWLATGCLHFSEILGSPHYPSYNEQIYRGLNTIGSPSVVAVKNDNPLLFDTQMTWLLDCDYYTRMFERYGEPTILNDLNVIMGLHKKQVTSVLDEVVRRRELDYMLNKYR